MDFQRHEEFEQAALATGLITRAAQFDNEPRFYLDLNAGKLCVKADAASVLTIVKLARTYEEHERWGEHQAILELVADRTMLRRKNVAWYRPHHVHDRANPRWVSMKDWLAEQGHPYIPLVS